MSTNNDQINMKKSWVPVSLYNSKAQSPVVLLCEHASPHIPDEFNNLGVNESVQKTHIAWDIGALEVAKYLSEKLEAPLVYGGVSRLLCDCNRPIEAEDCIPEKSESFEIPGNFQITKSEQRFRHQLIHTPFHQVASSMVKLQAERTGERLAIIAIHSFTSEYLNKPREIDLGFIHNKYASLSDACVKIEQAKGVYRTALNQPYDVSDGVTYTIQQHGDMHSYHSTMVEINNLLIDNTTKALTMASHLLKTLDSALKISQSKN